MLKELATLIKRVEEKYEKGCIVQASDSLLREEVRRIPTGIFSVDVATGGGFPIGMISRLIGKESAGKSALALKIAAGAQRLCRKCLQFCGQPIQELNDKGIAVDAKINCPNCGESQGFRVLWFDAEGVWTRSWAEKMGVILPWMYVARTEFAEQGIDVADALLRTGEFDLLVIDSLAHLTPAKEIEAGMDEWQMGLQARLINKAMRKWVSAMVAANVSGKPGTIIAINQIRQTMAMWGSPETTPGGVGQNFASSLDLYLKKDTDENSNGWKKGWYYGEDTTLGMATHFVVSKSRVCPPKVEGAYTMWLVDNELGKAGQTDDRKVVLEYLKKYDLLVKEGVKYRIKGIDKVFSSQSDIMDNMLADDIFNFGLRKTLMEEIFKGVN